MKPPSRSLRLAVVLLAGAAAGRAAAAPRTYELDAGHSRLVIHVSKAGALSSMLHDHAFVPQHWRGEVSFDADALAATHGEVVVDAASLRDEEPALSAADKAKVEEQARGPDVLDAAKYPEVRLEVTSAEPGARAPEGGPTPVTLVGTFHLHGRSAPVRIPLLARWSPEGFEARGQARFRQSDFGIRPLSKLLGAIAVKDDVVVELDVRGAARQAQPPP
jgi:polyisoprenoid-binding protein YceI